ILLGHSAKRVTEPADSADEAWMALVVAERGPDLRDHAPQAGFRHKALRPEPIVQLRPRDGRWPPLDERSQALVGLRRERAGSRAAPQLARPRIEDELAEPHAHRRRF